MKDNRGGWSGRQNLSDLWQVDFFVVASVWSDNNRQWCRIPHRVPQGQNHQGGGEVKKWRNHHHMVPRSRQGLDNTRNLLLIHGDNHIWWHKVFGNRTFDEVINLLIRVRRAKRGQSWAKQSTSAFAMSVEKTGKQANWSSWTSVGFAKNPWWNLSVSSSNPNLGCDWRLVMSNHRVTDRVGFGCQACRSTQLVSLGAVRTDESKIYFVFLCENCGESVPIEVDKVIAELYSASLSPTSMSVN